MRKCFVVFLTLIICFSFSACKEETPQTTSNSNVGNTSNSNVEFTLESNVCEFDGCTLFKIENSLYCLTHTCRKNECYEVKTTTTDSYGFCEEHECNVSGCENAKGDNSKYCYSHTCYYSNCNELSSSNLYCSAHTSPLSR